MMSEPADGETVSGLLVTIICAAVLLVGMAVNLPIPMYRQYALISGGGSYTLAFACYALGVLPALFFFGGISDRLGRRILLQAALMLSLLAVAILSAFPGLPALAASRLAQGLAIGLVGASATAFLAETLPGAMAAEHAAAYVTAMLALGYAFGALLTGLCLFFGPAQVPLSFPLHMIAVATIILMFWKFPNIRKSANSPILRLPLYIPGGILPCLAIGVGWCLVGVILSIVPVELSRHHLAGWSGISTFMMPLTGVLCQPLAKRLPPIQSIRLGLLLTPAAGCILAIGMITDSLPLVLLGTTVCGASGVGFSFYGGLAAVSQISGAERARASAGFFLASYIGLCGAPLILGLAFTQQGMGTALAFLAIFLLAASAALELAFRISVSPPETWLAGLNIRQR